MKGFVLLLCGIVAVTAVATVGSADQAHLMRWADVHGDQIVFTYEDAESEYGVGNKTFSRAIDQLISHGFIDIARVGIGIGGYPTLYSISERWRKYGQPDFDIGKRVKREAHRFPKGSANPGAR